MFSSPPPRREQAKRSKVRLRVAKFWGCAPTECPNNKANTKQLNIRINEVIRIPIVLVCMDLKNGTKKRGLLKCAASVSLSLSLSLAFMLGGTRGEWWVNCRASSPNRVFRIAYHHIAARGPYSTPPKVTFSRILVIRLRFGNHQLEK